MDSKPRPPRPQRAAVLVVIEDNMLKAYAPPHIDIRVAKIPEAHAIEVEQEAEDWMFGTLPPRYAELYRSDWLRASETTDPLRSPALIGAYQVLHLLDTLSEVA